MTTRFADHLLDGIHADRPAATAVPVGTLFACSDHALIYQSDGATWDTWAVLGGGGAGGGGVTQEYVGYNVVGTLATIQLVDKNVTLKQVTLGSAGLITDVEAYLKGGGGGIHALTCGIWADDAGLPTNLLSMTAPDASSLTFQNSTTGRWVGLPLGRWCPAGTYWIGVMCRKGASGTPWEIAFDGSGTDRKSTMTGAWLNDITSSSVDSSRNYSIRANVIR